MSSRVRAFVRAHQSELLILWLFSALAWALFIRTWLNPTTHWVGLPGDPAQHMWFLRWVPHALSQLDNPLFTRHINFPDGVNLMWNTSMPLLGLVLAPISVLVSPVVAYNVL